MHCNSGY